VAAQPLLPCRITGNVGQVIIAQVHLDVALARAAQERELVGPEVRVVQGHVGASPQVPLTGGIEGRVRPESGFVAGAVSPESTAGLPKWPQAVLVSHRVLDHQRCEPVGVRQRQAEPDRPRRSPA
jgi:hypothetical protein